MKLDEKCPKCGAEKTFGFGLAGGGYGPYEMCLGDDCDYFKKEQEKLEKEPDKATAPTGGGK